MTSPRVVVVGGGISGLAAAWRLRLLRPDAEITVLEAAARWGGKLVTEVRDGFLVEGAADGFLARKPPALEWAQALGLSPNLIEPRPEHRFSQVWWQGSLYPLPEGFSGLVPSDPEALLRSALLTAGGAARAAAEGEVPCRPQGSEESVEAFFVRRYGPEAFDRLMEPLLAGIYAGDAAQLSAEAAFPQLVSRERSGQPLGTGAPSPPSGPAFRSFNGGMAQFPGALERVLRASGVTLLAGKTVSHVTVEGAGFAVAAGSEVWRADSVILALPPRAAGRVLGVPGAAAVLSSWPVSSVANLNLAFDSLPGLPPGSGFVAPRAGRTAFSAATWASRKWPGRAPGDGALVRVYFGGARDPEGWRRPEAELLAEALGLLATVTGSRPTPRWTRLFRWKDAFAQPNLGHARRHETLQASLPPGLVLAGGYFTGVGVPDCLARAETAAQAVDRFLATGDIEP